MTAATFAAPGQLVEYWTRGKGAAKIRWGTDGDFDRCVKNLRKYFPKNPEGLCNRLHTRATGKAPGKHSLEAAVTTAVDEAIDPDEAALVPQMTTWSGLIAPINKPTGDRRRFAPGSLSSRDLPLPLLMQTETDEGHKKSVIVGRITGLDYQADGVYATGDFLDPALFPAAGQAIEQIRAGVIGPSVDLDDLSYEYRNADGSAFSEQAAAEAMQRGEKVDQPEFVVTEGRISAATLVAIPAFAEVRLTLGTAPDADGAFAALMDELAEGCAECEEMAGALTAAGAAAPPLAAFADPGLTGPTPLTITDDGRVFGHLATWETCHVGFPGTCVTPPNSANDYAFFHTGEVRADDGSHVPVGRIVVGTKHADLAAGFRAASQHYDETGRVAALVRAGEDAFGIWVAGVLNPGANDEVIAEFRANPPSGDWRRVGAAMELIGAVAVPVPGFPVARATRPEVAAALEPQALVAAGVLAPGMVARTPAVTPALVAAVKQQIETEARVTLTLTTLDELKRQRQHETAERAEHLLAALSAGRG